MSVVETFGSAGPEGFEYFYSPSTRGFYLEMIHGKDNIPADAVGPISEAVHSTLIEGQNMEMEIRPDESGWPKLMERIFTLEQLQNSIRHIGKQMRHEAAVAAGFDVFDAAIRYAPLGDEQSLKFLAWGKDLYVAIEALIAGKTEAELLALKKDRAGTIALLPPFPG